MKYFKDTQNKIHDDDNGRAKHMLPAGCVEITQAEADAILNPPKELAELNAESNAIIQAQIAELEAQQARPLREIALGYTTYAVSKLQSLNNQIAALRAQLV